MARQGVIVRRLAAIPDVDITALCDVREARAVREAKALTDAGKPAPALFAPRHASTLRQRTDQPAARVGGCRSTSGQRGRIRTAQISGPDSPAANRSAPAKAIIAPLSVHSAGSG